MFSLPGHLAPLAGGATGGKLGQLAALDTPNPVLYIEYPSGRLKLHGTIARSAHKWITLQCAVRSTSRGDSSAPNIVCEDVFDAIVTFTAATWVGAAADNPAEVALPIPAWLLQVPTGTEPPDAAAFQFGCGARASVAAATATAADARRVRAAARERAAGAGVGADSVAVDERVSAARDVGSTGGTSARASVPAARAPRRSAVAAVVRYTEVESDVDERVGYADNADDDSGPGNNGGVDVVAASAGTGDVSDGSDAVGRQVRATAAVSATRAARGRASATATATSRRTPAVVSIDGSDSCADEDGDVGEEDVWPVTSKPRRRSTPATSPPQRDSAGSLSVEDTASSKSKAKRASITKAVVMSPHKLAAAASLLRTGYAPSTSSIWASPIARGSEPVVASSSTAALADASSAAAASRSKPVQRAAMTGVSGDAWWQMDAEEGGDVVNVSGGVSEAGKAAGQLDAKAPLTAVAARTWGTLAALVPPPSRRS